MAITSTTLSRDLGNNDQRIYLTSMSGVSAGTVLQSGLEYLGVLSIGTGSALVKRGLFGTPSLAASSGATISVGLVTDFNPSLLISGIADGSPVIAYPSNPSQNISTGGGGNPFDQDLNTTDVVQFAGVGIGTPGVVDALTFGGEAAITALSGGLVITSAGLTVTSEGILISSDGDVEYAVSTGTYYLHADIGQIEIEAQADLLLNSGNNVFLTATAAVGIDAGFDEAVTIGTTGAGEIALNPGGPLSINGTPGIDFSGPITNLTIVKGIVTAAS